MEMNDNIDEIIQKLDSLDLCKKPREEIISLMRQVGSIPSVVTILHPGRLIVRGRVYTEGEDFTSIQSHSYNPIPGKKYQRANIPGQSIFYGAVTSDVEEEPLARFTILTEISNTLSHKEEREKVMFSAWRVIEDISLYSIIQSKNYQTPNNQILELEKRFNNEIRDNKVRKFTDFIASEFAKSDIADDYYYMISAWFSYFVYQTFDGIYYPSVRIDGAGMNVAILPEIVDTKMKFWGAVDCDVIRNDMDIRIIDKRKSVFRLEYVPIIDTDYQ